ncbi:long-chain-fatty-acid--CoA ligase [Bradyrhizobium brasilense]|uniref:long-chain-fatty-acid--CoA ligase n=1 Tax=Bradyrhizobium brasilense TaxID=1419277 RepID=UPI0024B17FDC|nr:long-chain-fatty-acid--CoA ligase [Bradyrhizobium australafricanum]WFU34033.1 long-chain-fatty-acid--CoA ligase [Bradyrhizobium australafricanum]
MLAGLMQQVPLTLNLVRERVADLYPNKTVMTRYCDRIHVISYAELLGRAGQLANFLAEIGVERGMRVATLAWNSHRHLELYFAVPCMGAVLHTINARLHALDIARLLAHAEDRVLFVDRSIWRTVGTEIELPSSVHHVVIMEDESDDALDPSTPAGRSATCYEDAIARHGRAFAWPALDENEACGLCYTSGTTGDPKGVLYSHRSATLHTMACLFADGIAMRERDVCLPAVPMFHANAWGFPYAALLAGASLALPCRQTDAASLVELIEAAQVTMATAVPTVWIGLLDHLSKNPSATARIASLKRLPVGGAAIGQSFIDDFARLGIDVMHCWGMTEISPLGLTNIARSDLDADETRSTRTAQGLPIPGCRLRTVDADGERCAQDGKRSGELQISSPWAAAAYFAGSTGQATAADSFVIDEGRAWLKTGDIATIDPHGYVRIVDRAKDLIKSGGEWISSQALELQIMNHPDVREAAAIGRPDPKWQERPLICVVLQSDSAERRARFAREYRDYLAAFFPKWQIPDDVIFSTDLPKGKTGKIDKIALRKAMAGS